MENSKLISLLKTFSKDEFKRLGQFVRSPFFNSEIVLINLYDELKKYFPGFEERDLDKRKIYEKLYPGRPFNDSLMRNILSDLLFLTEEFLVHNTVAGNAFQKKISLLRELTNKKQNVLFNKHLRQAEKILNESNVRDENFYYNTYLLEDEKTLNIQTPAGKSKAGEDNFARAAGAFIDYALVELIKYKAIMLNQKKYIFDFDYSFGFMDEMLDHAVRNKDLMSRIPYLDIYYNSIMLFKTEEKRYFDKLRSSLRRYFGSLNKTDKKNIYVTLVNHCSEQINKGRLNFVKEKFELYKEIIKHNIHFEGNKFISHVFFINVVSNSLELKEFKWCETFIRKYRSEVPDEFRKDTYHFCLALIRFEKNEFDQSLTELSKVHFSDFVFKWSVNCLELMIYYSTDSSDIFDSRIDSFRHMISNRKVFSGRRRKLISGFISAVKKLYSFRHKDNLSREFEMLRLKDEIEGLSYVFGKSWLLKKTRELIAMVGKN